MKQQAKKLPPNKLSGFLPLLKNYNLTVLVLSFLKRSKLLRQISRVCRGARAIIFSSLIWSRFIVDTHISPLIPNFKSLNRFFQEKLKDYEYLQVLDMSNVIIKKPDKVHRDFFAKTMKLLSKSLLEFYHPKWLPCNEYIKPLIDLKFSKLKILHLPKLYTCGDTTNYIQNLSKTCPRLQQVSFIIDEQIESLPIDSLFQKSEFLTELVIKFDLPRYLLETGSESRLPTPQTEPLYMSWIDQYLLFTDAINLEHLEIKRRLKFRTIASKQSQLFKRLQDSHHYPLGLKGRLKISNLKTLIIEEYFSIYLIIDLVQINRQLKHLRLKRKSFDQQLILSDTLFLEMIDVKLNQKATLVLGENLSLTQVNLNCQIEMNNHLPKFTEIIFKAGYRPSLSECEQISKYSINIQKIICQKRQIEDTDVANPMRANLNKKDNEFALLQLIGMINGNTSISKLNEFEFHNSQTSILSVQDNLQNLKLHKCSGLQQLHLNNATKLESMYIYAPQLEIVQLSQPSHYQKLTTVQIQTHQSNQVGNLGQILSLKALRVLTYQCNFYQKSAIKKQMRLTIESQSLEVIRLLHTGDQQSNVTQISFINSPKLTEICLEKFGLLKQVKTDLTTCNIKNLFLRYLSGYFRKLLLYSSFHLRNFELFLQSHLELSQIVNSDENYYDFKFCDSENIHRSEQKAHSPSDNLKYFKYLMNFQSGFPTKAGMKWKSGQSQIYFRNQNQGKERSTDLTKKLFPFLYKIMQEDLYQNGYGIPVERDASDKFESKRGTLFQKKSYKQYMNVKESIKEKEVFPREGVDTFDYEAQLYLNQQQELEKQMHID
ncbi:UNKNOWN [Stylonychia lemnae]|uniref:F-box domain-containing protein n=1 Tax=Stylonychia lemnae TaxID=5949 RepID=A0A078A1G3_STYLE|nr:UNKNOWN [Stylonychia lemnae]|eukprot:CDW74619.1 UNKNOWN [Stylonychia lemnae]